MLGFLKRLFGLAPAKGLPASDLSRMVPPATLDLSWMVPPATLVDPVPWDQYWREQLVHGVAGFNDLFCDDGQLIDVMHANGLKTVICVGNGVSQEPCALAWAGYDVTALDLSPLATEIASKVSPPDESLARLVGDRSRGMNGRLQFVVGDLLDPGCCPGPYDVVIERKTLQLFPEGERPAAMQAVADRLGSPGIFFSQAHQGRWQHGQPRIHVLESSFRAEGWPIWRDEPPKGLGEGSLKGRVAWLLMTTG